jgi:hypothetical protein
MMFPRFLQKILESWKLGHISMIPSENLGIMETWIHFHDVSKISSENLGILETWTHFHDVSKISSEKFGNFETWKHFHDVSNTFSPILLIGL